jgi:lysophospholipase L1-like esterase
MAAEPAIGLLEGSADPELVFRLRPNASTTIFGSEVRTEGFRDATWTGEPQANEPGERIVIVGDSVAFGYKVRQDELFPAILQQLIRAHGENTRVYNLSVPGYGIQQERRLLELYVPRLHPTKIIIAYCLNDPDPGGGTTNAFRAFHPPMSATWELLEMAKTRLELSLAGGDYHRYIHEKYQSELLPYFRALEAFKTKDIEVSLLLIQAFVWSKDRPYPYADIHEFIRMNAEHEGIGIIDSLSSLQEMPVSELGLDIWHPSPMGHCQIAKILFSQLLILPTPHWRILVLPQNLD